MGDKWILIVITISSTIGSILTNILEKRKIVITESSKPEIIAPKPLRSPTELEIYD